MYIHIYIIYAYIHTYVHTYIHTSYTYIYIYIYIYTVYTINNYHYVYIVDVITVLYFVVVVYIQGTFPGHVSTVHRQNGPRCFLDTRSQQRGEEISRYLIQVCGRIF